MNNNATSLILYTELVEQCDDAIKYWQGQPESQKRANNLLTFAARRNEHSDNIERLHTQIVANDENLKDEITKVLDWLEFVITTAGGFLGKEIKEQFIKWINIAKKFLENL